MLTGVLIPSLLGLALGKPAVDPSWCGRVAALDRTESRPHLEGELSREGELAVPVEYGRSVFASTSNVEPPGTRTHGPRLKSTATDAENQCDDSLKPSDE